MSNIISLSLIVIAAIAVIIFLIWKNKKDKKVLNPDAQDSIEEVMMDLDQKKDRT
jgi:uncharacterized protein YoxC